MELIEKLKTMSEEEKQQLLRESITHCLQNNLITQERLDKAKKIRNIE